MSTPQPLGFLDLPPELRLAIYEQLHTSTVSVVQKLTGENNLLFEAPKFQTALLATCKIINEEAAPVLQKAMIEVQPQITYSIHGVMNAELGFLVKIVSTMAKFRFDKNHSSLYNGPTTSRLALVMLWRDTLRLYFVREQYKLIQLCDFCADATQHLRKTGHDLSIRIHCPAMSERNEHSIRYHLALSPGTSVVIMDTKSDLSGEGVVGRDGAQ